MGACVASKISAFIRSKGTSYQDALLNRQMTDMMLPQVQSYMDAYPDVSIEDAICVVYQNMGVRGLRSLQERVEAIWEVSMKKWLQAACANFLQSKQWLYSLCFSVGVGILIVLIHQSGLSHTFQMVGVYAISIGLLFINLFTLYSGNKIKQNIQKIFPAAAQSSWLTAMINGGFQHKFWLMGIELIFVNIVFRIDDWLSITTQDSYFWIFVCIHFLYAYYIMFHRYAHQFLLHKISKMLEQYT